MAIVTKTVDVDFDIEEFSDAELLEEIEARGYSVDGDGYDLDLVDTEKLIDYMNGQGFKVLDDDFITKETLDYIISILPDEKIGSENFFHQERIRNLYSEING